MNLELGQFAEGFMSYRRLMATVPETRRLAVFENAVAEAATYVARGLDRTVAADELTEMASISGFDDVDAVQWIISRGFENIEPLDRVPDDIIGPKPNGGNGAYTDYGADGPRPSPPPTPTATLYVFPDPADIPPRNWLYGGHYIRECATATVAPGGFGKTTLTLFEMLAMAQEGLRVWYISGEDPKDEVDRRIAAHCQHHNVNTELLSENLYIDDRSSFPLYLGNCPRTAMVKFDEDWLTRLEQEINGKQIDVIALDPFISFHAVPESDNGAIDQIVKRLSLIAKNTKSCVELSHHTRKPIQGMNGELTVDDTRGGSAIVNAVRSCRIINRMTADEAGLAKIPIDKRTSHIRIDKGKRNMAPSEVAQWWHIVSVALPNGDNVQAIEKWKFPDSLAGADPNWVQKLLKDGGPKRASSQSDDWIGHDLGRHCGRDDTTLKGGAIWANKILGEWVRNKVIKKVGLRDPITRKPNTPFYVHPDYKGDVVPFVGKKDQPPMQPDDDDDD